MTRGIRRVPEVQTMHSEGDTETGTLLDGTVVEFVVDVDGQMRCVSPASVEGMQLVRRNDATKDTPGTLKLVGKPKR